MSEPTQPSAGFFTPAHAAPPAGDPAYRQLAQQAVDEVQQPDQGTDAGQSIEEIKAAAVRAALGEFEQRLAAQMETAQAAFSQQAALIEQLQRQVASVRATAGPPLATLLAASLSQRVKSIASANPDLPPGHFAGVISQGESLEAEVRAIADGNGDAARAGQIASGVAAWFTRAHPRISNKVLEGSRAVLDEAERLLDELPELAPVVAAAAKVL